LTRDVVDTPEQAARLPHAPLLVRRPVEAFLDAHGLGRGPLRARRLGEGHSNVTFLVEREGASLVLRRPPRPPLPPSAHDVVREARIQLALSGAGVRVPQVLAICEDEALLGVPFYVMPRLDGRVLTRRLPAAHAAPAERRRIGEELVDALAEIHAVDVEAAGLAGFGRPQGYLERQVRRFAGLWEVNATRELPQVAELAAWLERERPPSPAATVVHGEYRLGNVLVGRDAPARIAAVLDWELATVGDPLADLGYLLATWSEPGSPGTVVELSPFTRRPGFLRRDELAARYAERSGIRLGSRAWYEALGLWKAAVFCEAIHGRWLRGEIPRGDRFAASLAEGVPALLAAAAAAAARA
jgi:aminoglycoside phosphotransferase (APT) family kinase protein